MSSIGRGDQISKRASPSRDLGLPLRPDPRGPAAATKDLSIAGMQATVDVARGQVALGRCDEAVVELERVIERLQQLDLRADPAGDVASHQRLIIGGSAYSLLGRCRDFEGEGDKAMAAFERSADLFDSVDGLAPFSARDWADYGETLARLGRTGSAIHAFTTARKLGFRSGESLRRLGALHLDRGDMDQAESILREAVDLTAEDHESPLLLAEVLVQMGRNHEGEQMFLEAGMRAASAERLQEGVEAFRRAAKLAPDDAGAWVGLGELLRRLGLLEDAREALDRALEQDPEWGWALGTRGQVLRDLGQLDAAVADLQVARRLDPDFDWIYMELAQALRDQGDLEQAFAVVREGLERAPDSPNLIAGHAELLWSVERFEEALVAVDEAVERATDKSWPLALRGEILRKVGRYEEALASLDESVANTDVPSPWTLATKGQVLRALGRLRHAKSVLEEALRFDSDLAWAREELAEILLERGDPEGALAQVEAARGPTAETASMLTLKARILRKLDMPGDAHDVARLVLEHHPEHTRAHLEVSAALADLGQKEPALQAATEALQVDPKSSDAKSNRAERLLDAGHRDVAVDELRERWAVEPGNIEVAKLLAEGLHEQGRHEEERDLLEQALAHVPDDASLLRMLGHAMLDLGSFDEAVGMFSSAASLSPDKAVLLADLAFAQDQSGSCLAAMKTLREAVEVEPGNAWVLTMLGMLYGDMGLFELALDPLRRAHAKAGDQWLTLHLTGWSLEHAGTEPTTKAHDAYRQALRLNPENLYTLRGVTDTRPGERASTAEYEQIIEKIRARKSDPDPALLALSAWCYFSLGRYDQAIDLYVKAISTGVNGSADTVSAQLDLALAVLVSGRHAFGVQEYGRGCHLSADLDPGRRHGVLAVAVYDLRRAQARGAKIEIEPVLELLEKEQARALQDAGGELPRIERA